MKWEYKVIGIDSILEADADKELEGRLNELGELGWELIGIVDQVDSGWGSQPRVCYNHVLMKRPKAE